MFNYDYQKKCNLSCTEQFHTKKCEMNSSKCGFQLQWNPMVWQLSLFTQRSRTHYSIKTNAWLCVWAPCKEGVKLMKDSNVLIKIDDWHLGANFEIFHIFKTNCSWKCFQQFQSKEKHFQNKIPFLFETKCNLKYFQFEKLESNNLAIFSLIKLD